MPNFPAALDSLSNPTANTNRDDPGYQLHTVISTLNDIAEAVEAKVGIGTTTPARNQALYGSATGSIWDGTSRKNRLYNGSMRVNQRITMPTADNAYTLDRWRMLLGAASTCTPSHEVTDTPAGGSRRAIKLAVTATNNNKFGIFQPLEGIDVWDLRGQYVSLSFWAKVSNARIGDVRAAVLQWTSTEDAISATPINTWGNEGAGITTLTTNWFLANSPANLGVTTSWVRYYIENIGPISTGMTNLGVLIWSDDKTTTAADALFITDVQLEKGAVCTDVERLPLQQELAACQRYYEKSNTQSVAPGGSTNGNVLASYSDNANAKNVYTYVPFKVVKRAAPTMTSYDNAGASGKITTLNAAGSGTNGVTPSIGFSGTADSGTGMLHNGAVAGVYFGWTAESEL